MSPRLPPRLPIPPSPLNRRDWLTLTAAGVASGAVHGQSSVAAGSAKAGRSVVVVAASDLKFVLTELVQQLERESAQRFTLNFGSSGQLAQQLRQGLPADLFLSADESYVLPLVQAGLTQDAGALYATGRIALIVPATSPIALDARLTGLKAQWASVGKFAIANPEHAPYGRAAQQALHALGLWDMVQPKLVLGENISQATQFVATGAAQAGITARSLAVASQLADSTRHVVLPDTLHAPLHQRMVLLRGASPAAQALYAYLQTPVAKAIFKRYGFEG